MTRSRHLSHLISAYLSPVFAPILTFAVFSVLSKNSDENGTLNTARAFTSLSLFALLTEPLQSLMMSLAMFMGAVGCFKRIQEFLDTAPRADTRRKPAYLEESLDLESEISSRRTSLSTPSRSSKKASDISLSDRTNDSNCALSGPRPGQSLEKLTLANYYQFSCAEAITIMNGKFGWDEEKEPLLNGINIKVPRTKLTMIVGPVGSGKSTLLKGMLGELPLTRGVVELSSLRLAFCDQTPWHMNGTIRESIVGASKFDERWYKSVLRGCALNEDLRQVANGDQTKIGSKGITLSGGQSQRIVRFNPFPTYSRGILPSCTANLTQALARAVYARKDIVIIDDALSGLDAETENHVWNSLLGRDGLLRRFHSTAVLASSSAKRLPYADHIVVLSKNGTIAEQGTFEQLNRAGGYVSTFTLPPPTWDYVAGSSSDVDLASYASNKPQQELTEDSLVEDAARRTGDVAVYLHYVRSVGWAATWIFIISITIFVFCNTFPRKHVPIEIKE